MGCSHVVAAKLESEMIEQVAFLEMDERSNQQAKKIASLKDPMADMVKRASE